MWTLLKMNRVFVSDTCVLCAFLVVCMLVFRFGALVHCYFWHYLVQERVTRCSRCACSPVRAHSHSSQWQEADSPPASSTCPLSWVTCGDTVQWQCQAHKELGTCSSRGWVGWCSSNSSSNSRCSSSSNSSSNNSRNSSRHSSNLSNPSHLRQCRLWWQCNRSRTALLLWPSHRALTPLPYLTNGRTGVFWGAGFLCFN